MRPHFAQRAAASEAIGWQRCGSSRFGSRAGRRRGRLGPVLPDDQLRAPVRAAPLEGAQADPDLLLRAPHRDPQGPRRAAALERRAESTMRSGSGGSSTSIASSPRSAPRAGARRGRAHEPARRRARGGRADPRRRRDRGRHELRRARAGLREEASQLAIELAAGILRETVTAQDRERLIDEFIERVARARGEEVGCAARPRRGAMRARFRARRRDGRGRADPRRDRADRGAVRIRTRAAPGAVSAAAPRRRASRGAAVAMRPALALPIVKNFFAFAIDQRRLISFDAIRAEFEPLADDAAGLVKARVTAAAPLDGAQRARLQGALAARTGRKRRARSLRRPRP